MRKKLLLVFLSVLLVSSLFLVACGKDKEQGGDTPAPAPAPTPAPDNKGSDPTDEPEVDSDEGWIRATDKSKIPPNSLARTDTIIIGMTEPDGVFNPWYHKTSYDGYVNDAIFNRLAEVQLDASYGPSLAKSWNISDDGTVYTFYLRDDVKFSDGTPLTAEDAEFAFYILADPKYDGESDITKAQIVGLDEYKYGEATTIEGVKVLDDHTLQVTVLEPRATTFALLAVYVLPKHYYSEGYSKGNLESIKAKHTAPLGSGSYVFDRFIPGQEVRLTANENYFKGAPKIKNLIFKVTTSETDIQMIQAGETDFEEGISVDADSVELLQSLGFVDLSLLLNNGYGFIGFNHNLPKFQDQKVRQALTYGLNREEIVYAYSGGYANVINVPESKVSWAYPPEEELNQYEFNPEKANQLLDEAGWVREADGFRYKDGEKFTIYFAAVSPNVVNDAIIPFAVENYGDLGIEFIAEQLDFNAVVKKIDDGDFDMFFLAWALDEDPDPTNVFHTNGSQNDIGYSNAKADRLMEEGLKELDQAKRAQIYHELYKELNEDLPYIFMYQRFNMNTINSRIQGFSISPYRDFAASLHVIEIE